MKSSVCCIWLFQGIFLACYMLQLLNCWWWLNVVKNTSKANGSWMVMKKGTRKFKERKIERKVFYFFKRKTLCMLRVKFWFQIFQNKTTKKMENFFINVQRYQIAINHQTKFCMENFMKNYIFKIIFMIKT
jgi:hypothetical protein